MLHISVEFTLTRSLVDALGIVCESLSVSVILWSKIGRFLLLLRSRCYARCRSFIISALNEKIRGGQCALKNLGLLRRLVFSAESLSSVTAITLCIPDL